MSSFTKILFLCFLLLSQQVQLIFCSSPPYTAPDTSIPPSQPVRKRLSPSLNGLGLDLILLIGEFVDFPHLRLGSLNRYLHSLLETLRPAQIISRQLSWPQLKNLPTSPDLSFLTTLTRNTLKNQLPELVLDVALIKALPNIKGPLLRMFLDIILGLESERAETFSFPLHHPFKGTISPLSAMLNAFIASKDYTSVFQIWDKFPRTLPTDVLIFSDELIKAAIISGKMDQLLTVYINGLSAQHQFDVCCVCLAVTFDERALHFFLKKHFSSTSDDFSLETTYLNAWIYALSANIHSLPLETIHPILQNLSTSLTVKPEFASPSVFSLKTVLLNIIAIQSGFGQQVLREFTSIPMEMYETILGCSLAAREYEIFFSFLRECLRVDPFFNFASKQLRFEITTAPEEFVQALLAEFNVNMLFSNDLHDDAYHNKSIYFKLLHISNEDEFLHSCQLGPTLFRYILEHFTLISEFNNFFAIKSHWTAKSFASFLQIVLRDRRGRRVDLFNLIRDLLDRKDLHITRWGISLVELDFEAAKFLLTHAEFLFSFPTIKFKCIDSSMADVLLSGQGHLSSLKFDFKDTLIRLPHENFLKKMIGSGPAKLNSIKWAIKEFHDLRQNDNPERVYSAIDLIFGPVIGSWKWTRPLDYLSVLPYPMLMQTIRSDPQLLYRALHQEPSSAMDSFLFSIRSTEGLKVSGPLQLPNRIENLLTKHRIKLTII